MTERILGKRGTNSCDRYGHLSYFSATPYSEYFVLIR